MRIVSALLIKLALLLGIALVLSPEAGAFVEVDGLIEPYMVANVGSSVRGVIDTVDVERGDLVKERQVVATLQSGVEKATMELAQARAEIETLIKSRQAQLQLSVRKKERIEGLYKEEAIAFGDMDEAETEVVLAEMALQEAKENKRIAGLELKRAIQVLERMIIRSPITGVVVERFLAPGEFVEEQPILKIAQIHPLYVEIIVPVELFGSIEVGMQAEVRPEEPVGGVYTAKVKIVDQVIDAASGTFGVRLELPNPDYTLPAGLKCKVLFPD
jgi:RND family efflux transporter MFP subunit